MPTPQLAHYFQHLERHSLDDLNTELRRLCASPLQLTLFERDGVLVVENVFTDADITQLFNACQRLDSLIALDSQSYEDINLEATGGGWKGQSGSADSHTGKLRKVGNLIDHGDEFKALAMHPSLIRVLSDLIGPDFCLHSKGFLMNKPPEVSSEKPWHQDSAYFYSERTVITVWIPLQDVDEANGCLQAIPGSHRRGRVPHTGTEAQIDRSNLDINAACKYPVAKGGICVMDQHTAHFSGINASSTARRAIIFRYQTMHQATGPHVPMPGDSGDVFKLMLDTPGTTPILHQSGEDSRSAPWRIPRAVQDQRNPSKGKDEKSRDCHQLGGSVSANLLRGEKESTVEKRHLIIARVLRQFAKAENIHFIDMGTDYLYPFYDKYEPTQQALRALTQHNCGALHYSSSFGLESLRETFRQFMESRFCVPLDSVKEIMINTGASQAFDALSRAFEGRYVLLPHLALPTVGVIAAGNGAELIRLPLDNTNGMIELKLAQLELDKLPPGSVRFLYLNSPVNPTGAVATFDHLKSVVQFAKRNKLPVVHDMDSWYTRHSRPGRTHNILEVPGAMECCITVLSISKEFGLPGLRVGFIAGCSKIINTIRMHNSTFAVMVPEICQSAAEAAFLAFNHDKGNRKDGIEAHITEILHQTVEGWKSLGWPDDAVRRPLAGFKYLVAIPPKICAQKSSAGTEFSGVELLDFYIASKAHVKLSTSRSFNAGISDFLRVVLMQNSGEVDEMFTRFRRVGIHYDMTLPETLAEEYHGFLLRHVGNDF